MSRQSASSAITVASAFLRHTLPVPVTCWVVGPDWVTDLFFLGEIERVGLVDEGVCVRVCVCVCVCVRVCVCVCVCECVRMCVCVCVVCVFLKWTCLSAFVSALGSLMRWGAISYLFCDAKNKTKRSPRQSSLCQYDQSYTCDLHNQRLSWHC